MCGSTGIYELGGLKNVPTYRKAVRWEIYVRLASCIQLRIFVDWSGSQAVIAEDTRREPASK